MTNLYTVYCIVYLYIVLYRQKKIYFYLRLVAISLICNPSKNLIVEQNPLKL